MQRLLASTIVVLGSLLCGNAVATQDDSTGTDSLMQGSYWRQQALDQLIPLWYAHVRDEEYGGFYMNLSRDWKPLPPWDKISPMVSRQVFSFSAAYLLSGDERYLSAAKQGATYLLEHAWDKEYGGWYQELTQTGEPKVTTKEAANQLYTDVGMTLYYFTTGDQEVLAHVMKSVEIRRTRAHDAQLDGYYQVLNRDLTVKDDGKNKHSHYGYVGSLLLNLYLATHDADILQFERHLTDLTLDRMSDQEGWVLGYGSTFDRNWKLTPQLIDSVEVISVGAQLTATLSFLRLYHQTAEPRYLERGKALGDLVSRWGWDAERGAWLDYIGREAPHRPVAKPMVSWWIQIYGAFLQLQLYNLTHDAAYLERFQKSERFFVEHMMDREFGGVYANVSAAGTLEDEGGKASPWHTSYHEIEHDLLNYLYLNLYVHKVPVTLHFKLDGGAGGTKHYVSCVDDPTVAIGAVQIDGKPWTQFDARERYAVLPPGKDLRVEVTLVPGR